MLAEEYVFLFDLDAQLLFDTVLLAIAVFFLFLLMSNLLFNPARKLLKDRQSRIAKDISDANEDKESAAALKAEYESKLKDIDKEAEVILSEARQKALKNESKIIDEAKQEAARIIDPNDVVSPLCHDYFIVISAFMLAILCTVVTEKIIEPMLGPYDPSEAGEDLSKFTLDEATEQETKAFRAAMLTLVVMLVALVVLCIPSTSIFRNASTGSLLVGSLLMNALIPILSLLFFVPSLVYGFKCGLFKSERDVVNTLYTSFAKLSSVFAIALTAGQFMKWFAKSNLGTILAFKGAELLGKMNLNYIVLLLIFILITTLVNILMNSGTAKWYIFAPVFVPMLMKLGIAPELTQLAYRIGDSCTNGVTPLNSFLPVILMFMQRYKKDAGIGTYVATLLPYSVAFLVAWSVFFVIWMLVGLPIGPGANLFY